MTSRSTAMGRPCYGLLVSIATAPSRQAAVTVGTLLAGLGIRSTLAPAEAGKNKSQPRWEILVFPETAPQAFAVLMTQLGD